MLLGVVIGGVAGALLVLLISAQVRQRREARRFPGLDVVDPGAVRRAEQQARRMLEASTGAEDWEMYRELGVLRVWGSLNSGPPQGGTRATRAGAPYAYLIYPFGPVVSYLPQTRTLLGELTLSQQGGHGEPVSEAGDVLAKWLALSQEEDASVAAADFQLPGRTTDPQQVRRDLWRLSQWEQARIRRIERARTHPA